VTQTHPLSYDNPKARSAAMGPRPQLKILGIFALLVIVSTLTTILNGRFLLEENIESLIRRTALFGVLGIGVAFVIITSGIDLSIGSVVGLVGTLLPFFMIAHNWPAAVALPAMFVLSALIGLAHGLLITKLRLQPFVVTLCGLLIYRGVARGITGDQAQGFGIAYEGLREFFTQTPVTIFGLRIRVPVPFLDWAAQGNTRGPLLNWIDIPMPVVFLAVIAIVSAILLNRTIWGRYLLALGRNEQAARFSGVNTDRTIISAYVLCSLLAGLGGMLFMFDVNLAQPSEFGNFYELYAIAAAVLGGCSLRGGEGTILGVVIGAAVMQVLRNSINLLGIGTEKEYAIIGAVILIGVIADELVKRIAAKRRATRAAA
jgi:ribose transport system permease protein